MSLKFLSWHFKIPGIILYKKILNISSKKYLDYVDNFFCCTIPISMNACVKS